MNYQDYKSFYSQAHWGVRIQQLATLLDQLPETSFKPEYGNKVIEFGEHITGLQFFGFQKFIIHSIYSWRNEDDERMFTNFYLSLARKQTKSFLASVVALYEIISNRDRDVYVAANSLIQAGALYKQIEQYSKALPLKRWSKKLAFIPNNSKIEVLSSNAAKLDGLNVGCFILDEFSMSPTTDMRDVLISSQLLQVSPLNLIISTHSLELSYPWLTQELPYLHSILEGKLPLTNYLPILFENDTEDEIQDEATWIKSNPILADMPHVAKFLRSELERGRAQNDLVPILTKNFNLISAKSSANLYELKDYENNISSCSLGGHDKGQLYVGVDLSYTNDLTSVAYVIVQENTVYCYVDNYIVDSSKYDLRTRQRDTGINFATLDNIHICEEFISARQVANDIIDKVESMSHLEFKGIYFDPALSSSFVEEITANGYRNKLVIVRQGALTLSPAVQLFNELLAQGQIKFGRNPLVREALLSVKEKRVNDALYFDKSVNRHKIDSYAALINVFTDIKIQQERDWQDLII